MNGNVNSYEESQLKAFLDTIKGADKSAMAKAEERQNSLAKPPGSLGTLESISIKMAGITGLVSNRIRKKCVVIMCADNGVVSEGVSVTPQSVTLAQTVNFTRRITGAGALARTYESDLCVIDVGINGDIPKGILSEEMYMFDNDMIIDRKIRKGTFNLAKGPAMTREEVVKAINTGIEAASVMKAKSYDIIGVGEMGIGNTTTSSAILCNLTGRPVDEIVGRGGGLDDIGFEVKKKIVREKGCETKYDDIYHMLSCIGGFDICAMVGVFLGAAGYRMPVVIDGYISAVAALVAYKINPNVKDYMFTSHNSKEGGYAVAVEELGLEPMLNLGMRLGEGSGSILAFEIIKGALGAMNYMATYEEAMIDSNYRNLIKNAKF